MRALSAVPVYTMKRIYDIFNFMNLVALHSGVNAEYLGGMGKRR